MHFHAFIYSTVKNALLTRTNECMYDNFLVCVYWFVCCYSHSQSATTFVMEISMCSLCPRRGGVGEGCWTEFFSPAHAVVVHGVKHSTGAGCLVSVGSFLWTWTSLGDSKTWDSRHVGECWLYFGVVWSWLWFEFWDLTAWEAGARVRHTRVIFFCFWVRARPVFRCRCKDTRAR